MIVPEREISQELVPEVPAAADGPFEELALALTGELTCGGEPEVRVEGPAEGSGGHEFIVPVYVGGDRAGEPLRLHYWS